MKEAKRNIDRLGLRERKKLQTRQDLLSKSSSKDVRRIDVRHSLGY